ncbi:hypothetical protein [Nonomuraea salmonea]|uniref:FtsX-like permease family protein n=1 Tax=Nonomuraea salmonea TaxID=46181 RepID=A0ABV5P406_9ACTN
MSFDLALHLTTVMMYVLLVALPLMIATLAVPAALFSAPRHRHERIRRRAVTLGLIVSSAGVAAMGLGAWLAREDSRYGIMEFAGMLVMTLLGAGLLVAGLGSLPSRLLELLGPPAERLPVPLRLAVRDLAQRRAVAAVAITLTMMATAAGIGLTVVVAGQTTQSRAEYVPLGKPGTLLVRSNPPVLGPFSDADTATVRAAMERALPGVPIIQSEVIADIGWYFNAEAKNVEIPEDAFFPTLAIGDEKLLRYLTGDPSTPYDEGTPVVITSADVPVGSVDIGYKLGQNDESTQTKTVPALLMRATEPGVETIFVPSEVVRDLGYSLATSELFVDPAVHRATPGEQRRLDDALDDELAEIHVERGFQAPMGWAPFAAASLVAAIACALAAGVGAAADVRQARVMRRTGIAFRWFGAARAGVTAVCGTVLGAVAGCTAGMSLLWPLTASTSWEDPPRVPFETPWLTIAAIVIGLPLIAAALGALLARQRP